MAFRIQNHCSPSLVKEWKRSIDQWERLVSHRWGPSVRTSIAEDAQTYRERELQQYACDGSTSKNMLGSQNQAFKQSQEPEAKLVTRIML